MEKDTYVKSMSNIEFDTYETYYDIISKIYEFYNLNSNLNLNSEAI